ncbi:hypothetical protein N657DRAFT_632181 [Parathielavia appendiculata]|uniref:Heterokaryon incompatibility domain-containing protein n=1 Tax=Parathielavia appendiculata TaxID=2587402 RepID=A0AAN6U3Y8_9PEZI|nr:hypothetical protein N657DRAFT_632181 [Parathielavia appendiculata]
MAGPQDYDIEDDSENVSRRRSYTTSDDEYGGSNRSVPSIKSNDDTQRDFEDLDFRLQEEDDDKVEDDIPRTWEQMHMQHKSKPPVMDHGLLLLSYLATSGSPRQITNSPPGCSHRSAAPFVELKTQLRSRASLAANLPAQLGGAPGHRTHTLQEGPSSRQILAPHQETVKLQGIDAELLLNGRRILKIFPDPENPDHSDSALVQAGFQVLPKSRRGHTQMQPLRKWLLDSDKRQAKSRSAVTVSREIGVRYLWIDSLCIIQPHHGCSDGSGCAGSEDWRTESPKMGQYYGEAYCTIAATSAKGSSEGFLDTRSPTLCIELPRSSPGERRLCVSDTDDFSRDINQAELNLRGGVLQERAISAITKRLSETFTAGDVYGVFPQYPDRTFLWRRAGEGLERITTPSGQEPVPSWSWMGSGSEDGQIYPKYERLGIQVLFNPLRMR